MIQLQRQAVQWLQMHNAATVAGMAFANTYLGVCHSLASEVSLLVYGRK